MRILGIESSSLVASVALVTDDILTAEYTVDFKKTHSQTLLPMLDVEMDTVDAIAVAGGPGSFTGLRIGAATAKGLGLALDKPLIHVPTVDAMAWNLWGAAGLVCPIMDAKRRQVYTGLYRMENGIQVIKKQCAMDAGELAAELNGLGLPVIFLGDGVPVYRELFEAYVVSSDEFTPDYLRKPQAEREREARISPEGAAARLAGDR